MLLLLLACTGLYAPDTPKDTDDSPVESDTPQETDSEPVFPIDTWDTSGCGPDYFTDCQGTCVPYQYRADGVCDDGSDPRRSNADLNCKERRFDGGDCQYTCGNDQEEVGEECDDGNLVDFDGCSSDCRIERCGDGVVQPGEECDDGDTGAACPDDCGICLDDVYEDNDLRTTPTPSPVTATIGSLRSCPSDQDWYATPLAVGDRLTVTATFDINDGDIDLSLTNPAGTTVSSANGTSGSETVTWTAAEAGDHAVRVLLDQDQGAVRGADYTLEVQVDVCPIDQNEDDDTPASAWRPTLPASAGLTVCKGDDDLVHVDLLPGERLVASAAFSDAEGDLALTVTDLIGGVLARGVAEPNAETVSYYTATGGPVLVQTSLAADLGAAAGVSYDLNLSTSTCADDAREQDDLPTGLTPLVLPYVQGGLVACPDDDDHLPLSLTTGGDIDVVVLWDTAEGNVLVELLDPSNRVAATATGANGDKHLSLTPSVTGQWHLRVQMTGDAGPLVGVPYEVTVLAAQCPVDAWEDNDARTAARPVTLPFHAEDLAACAADEDWYEVPLTAGDQLHALARFDDDEGDVELQIYDPAGTSLGSSRSSDDDEELRLSTPVSGNHTVKVWLDVDDGGVPGNSYDLDIDVMSCPIDAHEPDDAAGQAALWSAPIAETWQACLGDPDVVDLALATGDVIDATITWSEPEADLTLEILDATGRVVREDSSGSGERTLSWPVTGDGSWSVQVRMTADQGTSAGVPYDITVDRTLCPVDALEPDDDDVQATVTTTDWRSTDLSACENDPDVFAIPANAGDRVWVYATFTDAEGDIELELRQGGRLLRSTSGYDDDEELVWLATASGTHYLTVLNDDVGVAGNSYDLDVVVSTCEPDAREDDDNSVQAPSVAPPVTFQDLTACTGDEDWSPIAALTGDWIEATATYDAAEGDVDLTLRDPLGSTVDYGSTVPGGEHLSWVVTRDGPHNLITTLQSEAGPLAGNVYDLELLLLRCPEDPLEQDDSSAQAVDASAGMSRADLVSCDNDEDWLVITVAPGQTIVVDAFFTDAEGDIDLQLKDAALATVRSATSSDDDESLSYQSVGGGTYYLRTWLDDDGGAVPGNPYSLRVQVL